MFESIIITIVNACCRRPVLTFAVALVITIGACVFTYENFAIHTDTSQLISSRLPWRQRELQLDAAFPQQVNTLLVVVDAETPELADDGAKRLVAALAKEHEHIETVREGYIREARARTVQQLKQENQRLRAQIQIATSPDKVAAAAPSQNLRPPRAGQIQYVEPGANRTHP